MLDHYSLQTFWQRMQGQLFDSYVHIATTLRGSLEGVLLYYTAYYYYISYSVESAPITSVLLTTMFNIISRFVMS